MKIKHLVLLALAVAFSFYAFYPVRAEDKNIPSTWTTSGTILKLPKTPNDPELLNNSVYPMWGPVCQRYTYMVTYRDKAGRKPEYVRIIFNGRAIDLEKQDPDSYDYKNGVTYAYKFVPNKLGSNFYYFEASNGLGKARAAIIDSPDNGPVLFESAFKKNEIAVIDSQTGQKILSYPTEEEWVGGVALSEDGKYLAAKTSNHVYLFDLDSPKEPQWIYTHNAGNEIGGDLKGGVAISGDGAKIVASLGESTLLFSRLSNKPLWRYDQGNNAYNVAISKDGKYLAAGTGGTESDLKTNLLILWSEKSSQPLWQYHASGNFHDVSLSEDGQYVAGSTGCPDRRFYVFSREVSTPIVRTESLTRDSPVHRARISADGKLAAVGSESDAGAVFLFKTAAAEPVWKFSTPNGSSVRALSLTPSGKYIGAATFGGQVYIFDRENGLPAATWVVNNAALGGVDISDDGSFIAAGGTDNKVHIFTTGVSVGKEVAFDEYVEEIDISGNGKYIAAGTGGSVYFFENISKSDKTFPCTTVIEPKLRENTGGSGPGQPAGTSLCGDGKCEGPETVGNCRPDCDSGYKSTDNRPVQNNRLEWSVVVFGVGFLGALLLVGVAVLLQKCKFLQRPRNMILAFNATRLAFLKLTGKKLAAVWLILATILLLATFAAAVVDRNQENSSREASGSGSGQPAPAPFQAGELTPGKGPGVCGNGVCEPDLGESKEDCPKDCSPL
ncbi:MAG: WD40 repeat domain-containing protein [Patescibacteria group bacterium]